MTFEVIFLYWMFLEYSFALLGTELPVRPVPVCNGKNRFLYPYSLRRQNLYECLIQPLFINIIDGQRLSDAGTFGIRGVTRLVAQDWDHKRGHACRDCFCQAQETAVGYEGHAARVFWELSKTEGQNVEKLEV